MLPVESLSRIRVALPIAGMFLLLSATASAQPDSGLAGAAIDESGLVLPGVTVGATEPGPHRRCPDGHHGRSGPLRDCQTCAPGPTRSRLP